MVIRYRRSVMVWKRAYAPLGAVFPDGGAGTTGLPSDPDWIRSEFAASRYSC
jgi:hypothetical protein